MGTWRKAPLLDGSNGAEEALLAIGERFLQVGSDRYERVLLLERHVAGARNGPAPSSPAVELLLCTDPVDRQLQRARHFRGPANLVVDDAERSVGEQVDAIG